MKTKKQASIDFLNSIAMSWLDQLKESRGGAQYLDELDRMTQALSDLDLDKLTVKQRRAVAHLVGSVARAAFSSGVELGKSFKKGGK